MELDLVIAKLKNIVKKSEASDGNFHLNLTLIPASKRGEYQDALKFAMQSIQEGKITRDKFLTKIGIDS